MSDITYKKQIISESEGDRLMRKWGKFLDSDKGGSKPVTDPWTRLVTAKLLEKQESMTLKENTASAGGVFGATQDGSVFSGDLYATGDARLPKVFIPMVRRTFPELMANEIVGVQPMSGPTGLAFGLRYFYEQDPLGVTRGDNLTGYEASNAGQYPHRAPADGEEAGYNYLNTAFTGTSSSDLSGNSEYFEFVGQDQGVAQLLKDFEISSNIGQMTFQISKTTVYAGTRRLATKFSLEAEEDIRAVMGIDIDNELVNTMSYEIQAEIDREIVMRMIQVCLNSGYGSGKGFSVWNAASADARWSAERGRDLYNRIIVESNRLAIKNRKGQANFIIATPSVCAVLQNLREFQINPADSTVKTNVVGTAKVGTVAGQFTVYRDTRTEAQYLSGARGQRVEYALLGYKGPEFYNTGIVFCPYIPLMTQRTIAPNDMSPRIGLRTRYGVVSHIFGSDLFYHMLFVRGLGEVFTPGQAAQYL